VPGTHVDVQDLDVDYFAFSFHKVLAPFGVGVLYGKEHLLRDSAPFLYGGDMIAPGQVGPDHVGYNDLPWKFAAGTPNILGTIVSAQALRLLLDLVLDPEERFFRTRREIDAAAVRAAFDLVSEHTRTLTTRAMAELQLVDELTIYGPADARERTSLVAFNVAGWNPMHLADRLNTAGVESRAGCHCASLAHRELGLNPMGSCRLSFYLYNTLDDVECATAAVRATVTRRAAVAR
jgi:cysteine desulfurase / selenocysteine lyase